MPNSWEKAWARDRLASQTATISQWSFSRFQSAIWMREKKPAPMTTPRNKLVACRGGWSGGKTPPTEQGFGFFDERVANGDNQQAE